MLKNCIFHEPVIHCDRHSVGIVSDIEFLHTILLICVLSFNRSRKILYFLKFATFFILVGCLQLCSLVNVQNIYVR